MVRMGGTKKDLDNCVGELNRRSCHTARANEYQQFTQPAPKNWLHFAKTLEQIDKKLLTCAVSQLLGLIAQGSKSCPYLRTEVYICRCASLCSERWHVDLRQICACLESLAAV